MNSQAIRMGQAFIELFASRDPLTKDLKIAKRQIQQWQQSIFATGTNLMGAGISILAPLAAAVRIYESTGSQLDDMSQRIGVTVEALSALGYAATREGSSIESLESAIGKMQVFLHAASEGSIEAHDTLAQLGIDFRDLKALSPDQQLLKFADALSKVANAGERTTLVRAVFGKGASELLPLLQQGSAGIRKITDEARRLGLVMSTEDAAAAAELGDSFARLWATTKGMAITIGAALAPNLRLISELFALTSKPIREWIDQNRELTVMLAGVGVGLVLAGVGLIGFAVAFKAVLFVYAAFAGTLAAIMTAFSGFLAILTSPLTLLAALAAAFLYFSGVGGAVARYLGRVFHGLSGIMADTITGITNLIAAGDIQGAMTVLWAGLQLIWLKGVISLRVMWRDFCFYMEASVISAASAIAVQFVKLGYKFKREVLFQNVTAGEENAVIQGTLTAFNLLQGARQAAYNAASGPEQEVIARTEAAFRAMIRNTATTPTRRPGELAIDPLDRMDPKSKSSHERTAGTFNAMAAGRLNGNNLQAAIASNTFDTAKHAKMILWKLTRPQPFPNFSQSQEIQ